MKIFTLIICSINLGIVFTKLCERHDNWLSYIFTLLCTMPAVGILSFDILCN